MEVTRTVTVPQRGIGKPDYSREISRSIQRAGIDLKYGQTLKSFTRIFTDKPSPFAWVTGELASGATDHLVDNDTGLELPWTLPEGYTVAIIHDSFGLTEDTEVWVLVDTYYTVLLSVSEGGLELYRNRVVPFSSATLDPTGASSHLIDIQVTNKGTNSLKGSFALSALVQEVGTEPLPKTKTVKCKHCGHKWEVENSVTYLTCPECKGLTIVYDLTSFKRTP